MFIGKCGRRTCAYHPGASGSYLGFAFFNLFLVCNAKITNINENRPILAHVKKLSFQKSFLALNRFKIVLLFAQNKIVNKKESFDEDLGFDDLKGC